MACLRKRKRKRDFVWIVDFYDNEGKRHWFNTSTSSRKVAEQMKAKIEVDLTLGKLDLPYGEKAVGLGTLKRNYLEYSRAEHSKSTYDLNERFLSYLLEFLGDVSLKKITRKDIEDYKIHRLARVKKTSVNMEIRHLKAAFNFGVHVGGYLLESPFSKVKQFKLDGNNLPEYLKIEEIEKLLGVIDNDEYKDLILFYLHTGCRRGEALGLTWQNIDLSRRTVKITKTKGGKDRQVPINDQLLDTLTGKETDVEKPFNFNCHFVTHKFKGYIKKAGLSLNFSVHSLRHTFASHLVMNGVDLYTVKELLGHSDIRVTEKYAHLAPDHLAAGVSRLPY